MPFGTKRIFSIIKPKLKGQNIILTGVPRSGSTLACKLLCDIPDVIGLNEPLEPAIFPNRSEALSGVANSFQTFRRSLLKTGKAPVRAKNGAITDNAFDSSDDSQRKLVLKRLPVYFDKPLSRDFTLILKHCAEFTLLFPELLDRFTCFATIRNPLALLGSWNSVNVAVSRGKVAKSARIHPSFYSSIEAIKGLHQKQLYILSWYFEQYTKLPKERIIRYEELVGSNGDLLNRITGKEFSFKQVLENRNFSTMYHREKMVELGELLLQSEGAYWLFYSKADVATLIKKYQ